MSLDRREAVLSACCRAGLAAIAARGCTPMQAAGPHSVAAYRQRVALLLRLYRRHGNLALIVHRTGHRPSTLYDLATLAWYLRTRLGRWLEPPVAPAPVARPRRLRTLARAARWLRLLTLPADGMHPPRRRPVRRMATLPRGWLGHLVSATHGRLQAGLLVVAACGARPSELAHGIQVRLERDAHLLALSIHRTKARQARRPLRVLNVEEVREDAELHACWAYLHALIDTSGEPARTVRCRRLSQAMEDHALKLWPEGADRPTAYAFRYHFRARCARHGVKGGAHHAVMGHRAKSAATARYGRSTPARHPRRSLSAGRELMGLTIPDSTVARRKAAAPERIPARRVREQERER